MHDMTYADAIAKAEHLLAVGQDTVYLRGDDVPWEKADAVEVGGGYRFSGPTGFYIIARERGLTFKWNVEFEERDATGCGVSLFARARLRDVLMRLPPKVRASFADLLETTVMPDIEKRSGEIRDALQRQWDSEDCVRGLIEYARTRKS